MTNHAPLLRASEVAAKAGCSVYTVTREARLGRLPYVQKFDNRTGAYLFAADAVDAWVAARKERAA